MSLIVATAQDGVGCIALNCPEKHNALSEQLVGEILAALALVAIVGASGFALGRRRK